MKLSFLRPTLACALVAALPAVMAAEVTPVTPVTPVAPPHAPATPPSALFVALQAVGAELQTASGGDKSMLVGRLDQFEHFHFSAPTQEKLAKVFGDTKPATFERVPAAGGARSYRFTLNPFSYTDPNGTTASWTTLQMEATTDKAGRTLNASGQWPSLDIATADVRSSMRGMRFATQQRRAAGDIWLGTAKATISNVTMEGVALPFVARFTDLAFDTSVTQHAKLTDVNYSYGAAHLDVAGQRIDALHGAVRLVNLDYAALQSFVKANAGKNTAAMSPQQQLDLIKPMFQALGRSAAKNGSAFVFDDISARFHGHTASLSGRMAFADVKDGDFDSLATTMNKVAATFDVRVPVALIREVALIVARQPQNGGAAPTPEQAAQLAETITDGIVGKLLNGGFAKLEDGVIVSHIDVKNGAVTANGKPIDFAPKPPANPPLPAGQPPRVPAARNVMPARELTDRCTRAPLPTEALRQNLTLETALTLTVGVDGRAHNIQITQSSGWPDYDAAVVDAAGRCEWLPALVDGKAMETPVRQRHTAKRTDSTDAPAPRS